MIRRRAPIAALAFVAVLAVSLPGPAAAEDWRPIPLETYPVAAFRPGSTTDIFGALEFRGGLSIRAGDPDFGGLSGLDIGPDGALVAISDSGQVFTARPVERDGRLTGLAGGRLAPLFGFDGRPAPAKHKADAEALRLVERDGGPAALVAFEYTNEVRLYRGEGAPALIDPVAVDLPAEIEELHATRGLEALAVAPADGPLAGAIVLIGERTLDEAGNLRGWILGGPEAGSFSIERSGGYDITDADFLADGSLMILERRFSIAEGLAMRIRHVAAADLRAGRTAPASVLMEAGRGFDIDNMEGLAVLREDAGTVELLVVSDDNHSLLQRTLLLKFAWRRGPD